MTRQGMAEARPDTSRRTCACVPAASAQHQRKGGKFAGKFRHSRHKHLQEQTNGESASTSRVVGSSTGGGSTATEDAGRRPPNTTTSSSNSTSSSGSPLNSSRSSSINNDEGAVSSSSASASGGASGAQAESQEETGANTVNISSAQTANNTGPRLRRQTAVSDQRRRSRSVDRYDNQRISSNPPPYSWVPNMRSRGSGGATVRRAGSEDTARRAAQVVTPPPPYDIAQSQNSYQMPPSYEEALANAMDSMSVQSNSTPTSLALRDSPPTDLGTLSALLPVVDRGTSRVLEEQAVVLEAQREAQIETQRDSRRDAQRVAQLEREVEMEMERTRLREMQLAQYCGCAKCQGLYYSYYYDDPMNDGGAFPMETQVLMQEVLTDGLAFCSVM